MSKTFKHKVHHIYYDKDGNLNIKLPLKLRWSYINKIRRHNLDYDLDRAELARKRNKANLKEMKRQIKQLNGNGKLKN